MSQFDITKLPQGPKGFVHDLGSDQRVFKGVPWGKATTKIFKENFSVSKTKQTIELCAIYWHFLLIVWLILFGLMVAT